MSFEIGKTSGSISAALSVSVTKLIGVTPTIDNVSAPVANTEVSYVFPVDTKKILMRCRGAARIQFSFISGQSGVEFITIPAGVTYSEDMLFLPSATIYFQTNLPNQIIEFLTWV
jgi:hypothetical protein